MVSSLMPAVASVNQPVSTELVAVSRPAANQKAAVPQIQVDHAPHRSHLQRGQSLKPSRREAKNAHHGIQSSATPRTVDAKATHTAAKSAKNDLSRQDRQLLQRDTEIESVAGLSAKLPTQGSRAIVAGATNQDWLADLVVTDTGDLGVLPAKNGLSRQDRRLLQRDTEIESVAGLSAKLPTQGSRAIVAGATNQDWLADLVVTAPPKNGLSRQERQLLQRGAEIESVAGPSAKLPTQGSQAIVAGATNQDWLVDLVVTDGTGDLALTAAACSATPPARPSNADVFAAITLDCSQDKPASTKSLITLAFSDRSTPIQVAGLEWVGVPIQLSLTERADPLAAHAARIADESSGKSFEVGGRSLWSLFFATALAMPGGQKAPQSTILLVETDESLRDSLTLELTRHGFFVLPAATGRDALNLLRTPLAPIDVMLLDLQLPDVSGVDLWKRLRDLQVEPPVVVCTGQAEAAQVVPLLPAGLRYYWQKPIEPNALVAAVSLLIRRAQGGAPETSPI
jgi:CheY-like chemotaxis protein